MRNPALKKILLWITAVALIFGLAARLNSGMKNIFEFNPDEGTNIIKAELLLKQYSLYKQIWSDQPPLFTALLSGWFKIFGASAYSGRILVSLFSALLLLGLYLTIRLRTDKFTAGVACALLILSAEFIRLSGSIMIGLPSLSLAVLALYNATVFSYSGRKTPLFLSAAFMALSLLTKFFTFFLIPLILWELACSRPEARKTFAAGKTSIAAPALWLAIGALIYFTVIAAYFYPDFKLFNEQLFRVHLAKQKIPYADFTLMFKPLMQDCIIALLAIVAIITNLFAKNRTIIFPASWLASAVLLLSQYRPIWYHYYLLGAIPLCWLAAIAIGQFPKSLKQKKPKSFLGYLTAALIIAAIIKVPLALYSASVSLKRSLIEDEKEVLGLLTRHKGNSEWILTDLPIFAHATGLLVPPETAVLTPKRPPTAKLIAPVLEKYKPDMVLLGNFKHYDPRLISVIRAGYRQEPEIQIHRPEPNMALCWSPIAGFLPNQMRISAERRLKKLIWGLKIPAIKHLPGFRHQDITLYIRKDIPGSN
jgi:hypothetical protein